MQEKADFTKDFMSELFTKFLHPFHFSYYLISAQMLELPIAEIQLSYRLNKKNNK